MIELRGQLDAPIGIRREILDGAVHHLGVADIGLHVVRTVDRRDEESDRAHGALDLGCEHVVADLERAQHEDERAGGEIGQQPAPGGADRDAERGDQRGERRRLDAEVAENPDDEEDVERDADRVADVADDRRLDLLPLERFLDQRARETDQPAADDVERDGAENLEAEGDERRLRGVVHVLQIHGGSDRCGARASADEGDAGPLL